MTSSEKIAIGLIEHSHGILTLPGKPKPDTLTFAVVPHVMPIAAYKELFGAKGEGK